jgi:hypothetical protein
MIHSRSLAPIDGKRGVIFVAVVTVAVVHIDKRTISISTVNTHQDVFSTSQIFVSFFLTKSTYVCPTKQISTPRVVACYNMSPVWRELTAGDGGGGVSERLMWTCGGGGGSGSYGVSRCCRRQATSWVQNELPVRRCKNNKRSV